MRHRIPEWRKSFAALLAAQLVLCCGGKAWSEVRTLVVTGEYQLGPHDSQADAKRLALLEAKRTALENAATFVERRTEIQNLGLSRDEIRAYAAGYVEVTEQAARVIGEAGRLMARVEAAVRIDLEAVVRDLEKFRQNEHFREELIQLRARSDLLDRQLADLQMKLATLKSSEPVGSVLEERDRIMKKRAVMELIGRAVVALEEVVGAAWATSEIRPESLERVMDLVRQARMFGPVLDEVDTLGSVHLLAAVIALWDGDNETAERELRQGIARNPGSGGANSMLAMVLLSREDWEGAAEAARKALAHDPNQYAAHYTLGVALAATGRPEEAVRELREAARLKPLVAQWARYHMEFGWALLEAGYTEESLSELRAATALAPDSAEAHHLLGLAFAKAKDPEGAIEHFRAALDLDPEDEEALEELSNALKAAGRWGDASVVCRYVLSVVPESPQHQAIIQSTRELLDIVELMHEKEAQRRLRARWAILRGEFQSWLAGIPDTSENESLREGITLLLTVMEALEA